MDREPEWHLYLGLVAVLLLVFVACGKLMLTVANAF